jgi:hypothetical protein
VIVDVREKLMEAAQAQDPKFPDGKDTKLTRFAYLGTVSTRDGGRYYLAQARGVLGRMLAPRDLNGGRDKVMVFDSGFKYLGSLIVTRAPLWTEGSKLFLAGRLGPYLRAGRQEAGGNAIDFSQGFAHFQVLDVKSYGSSGGMADSVPSEAQRKRERTDPNVNCCDLWVEGRDEQAPPSTTRLPSRG